MPDLEQTINDLKAKLDEMLLKQRAHPEAEVRAAIEADAPFFAFVQKRAETLISHIGIAKQRNSCGSSCERAGEMLAHIVEQFDDAPNVTPPIQTNLLQEADKLSKRASLLKYDVDKLNGKIN